MSFWFLPESLSEDAFYLALAHKELELPARGMPDLSRATSGDHIKEWLRNPPPPLPNS